MTTFEEIVKHGIASNKVGAVDEFGDPIVPKGSSPFETKLSAKKVINPNQNSLQGYLQQAKSTKALQKATSLHRAFLKHCAQNKIDPASIIGVNKK